MSEYNKLVSEVFEQFQKWDCSEINLKQLQNNLKRVVVVADQKKIDI